MSRMEIEFTSLIFKERKMFVAYAPELDVCSCARTKEKAVKNLKEAVRLFLEAAEQHGTLEQILEEAGYTRHRQRLEGPKLITSQQISLPVSLAYAKN